MELNCVENSHRRARWAWRYAGQHTQSVATLHHSNQGESHFNVFILTLRSHPVSNTHAAVLHNRMWIMLTKPLGAVILFKQLSFVTQASGWRIIKCFYFNTETLWQPPQRLNMSSGGITFSNFHIFCSIQTHCYYDLYHNAKSWHIIFQET